MSDIMSKYKWDLCELRNNIDTLKKLYEIENNENRKNLIIEYIEVYKNMINIFSENKNINNNLLDDSLQYDSINNLIEEQIISYNNNDLGVLNMVLQSYLPFREIYSSNYQLYEVPIFNTNEEVVELTNDFFIKMLPNNIIRDFKKLLMSKNMINFNTVKRNSCYSGITVIDPILEKKYVYVSRINQLIDLVTLPHELFHCLFNDFNTHLVTNYNMYYL